jgi:hypothetical protein
MSTYPAVSDNQIWDSNLSTRLRKVMEANIFVSAAAGRETSVSPYYTGLSALICLLSLYPCRPSSIWLVRHWSSGKHLSPLQRLGSIQGLQPLGSPPLPSRFHAHINHSYHPRILGTTADQKWCLPSPLPSITDVLTPWLTMRTGYIDQDMTCSYLTSHSFTARFCSRSSRNPFDRNGIYLQ